jgi:cation transport ATPase
MGKRSRKRRAADAPVARTAPKPGRTASGEGGGGKQPASARARGAEASSAARVSRSEAKNAAARAELEPLAPGERPLPVTIGAFVALGLIVANVVVYVTGLTVRGDRPALVGFLAFSVVMLAMAWGLWKVKYWAVLGLQALLGLVLVIVGLVALLFNSVTDLLICIAIMVPAAWLFWKLVKAMARIQMPRRPERER